MIYTPILPNKGMLYSNIPVNPIKLKMQRMYDKSQEVMALKYRTYLLSYRLSCFLFVSPIFFNIPYAGRSAIASVICLKYKIQPVARIKTTPKNILANNNTAPSCNSDWLVSSNDCNFASTERIFARFFVSSAFPFPSTINPLTVEIAFPLYAY